MFFKSITVALLLFIAIDAYSRFTPSPTQARRLLDHFAKNPTDDVVISIPIYMDTHEFLMPDVAAAADLQIRHELLKSHLDHVVNYKFDLRQKDNVSEEGDSFAEHAHLLTFKLRDFEALSNDPLKKESEFIFTQETMFTNDFPFFLTQTLVYQIFNEEMSRLKTDKFHKTEKYVEHNEPVAEKGHLSFTIHVDENLNMSQIQEALSFEDLKVLYLAVDYTFDNEVQEFDRSEQSIVILQELEAQKKPELNGTSIVVYASNYIDDSPDTPAGELNVDQLVEDVKGTMFNQLGFIKDPKVIPLRIEMELRFFTVINLLKFLEVVQELPDETWDTQENQDKLISAFNTRAEIVRILRDEYDWPEAYRLSRELVRSATLIAA